jgi:hypothetical protein
MLRPPSHEAGIEAEVRDSQAMARDALLQFAGEAIRVPGACTGGGALKQGVCHASRQGGSFARLALAQWLTPSACRAPARAAVRRGAARATQPAAGPANSRCLGDLQFAEDYEATSMQSGGLHAARAPAGARLAIAYQMFWHL